MNHPDKEWQERIEQRLEKLERTRGETEPIKITRLEIDSGGMQELLVQANKQLERIIQTQTGRSEKLAALERGQQELKQELYTLSNNWLNSLQENVDEIKQEMQDARADTSNIKATQSDHGEMLREHSTRLERIETAMATKDDIAGIKATQEERFDKLERTQDLILQLLQQKGE